MPNLREAQPLPHRLTHTPDADAVAVARAVGLGGHRRRRGVGLVMVTALALLLIATTAQAQRGRSAGHTEPGASDPDVLTLEQALMLAERVSPLNAIARSQTEEAILQRFAVRMERAPDIRVTLAAGPGPAGRRVEREDGSVDAQIDNFLGGVTFGGEARVTVPLTTFGKLRLATQLAEIGIEAAELQEQAARIETRYEVLRAYMGLQWYRRVRPVLDEAWDRLNQAEETLLDRLDDGDFTARTSLRQLTIYRADIVGMRGELEQAGFLAGAALALFLGVPEDVLLEPFDEHVPAVDIPGVREVVEYAEQGRIDMQRLDAAERAAQVAVRLQRRALAPDGFFAARGAVVYTPTLPGSIGVSDTPNRFNDLSGEVLVGLRWDLQPGRHRARVLLAEQRLETVRLQRDGAERVVSLDVREAWMETRQQLNQLRALADARRAAEAWLTQRAFQFDQGFATFDDLVEPLRAYYQKTGEYYEALLRFRLRVANLAVQIGWSELTSLPGWDDTSLSPRATGSP